MRKYIFFALFLLFIGCNQKTVTEPEINYIIEEIIPDNSFIGDTVAVYGNDFGIPHYSSKIVLTPDIEILSEDAILWQNTKILFQIPKNAQSGNVEVYVLDSLIGAINLNIQQYRNYETIIIEAGTFLMGSENGSEDELPVHTVNITHNLEVMTKEVTAGFFEAVMGYKPNGNNDIFLPVKNVRWIEAVKFANELSIIEGLDTCYTINEDFAVWNDTSNGWRLPTEAEWEFLAKAGNNFDFPYNSDLFEYGWFSQNSGLKTQPGGRKQPNENGIYDMNGNVREWCWDFYGRDYYSQSPADNPKGPAAGEYHISRGGSAIEGSYFARNSSRKSAENLLAYTGFRLVRTIKE